jgi:hypothetical protein
MFPLFALPREIRDLIYTAVLNSEMPPPATPIKLHEARESPSPGWHSQCNRYSLLAPTVSAGPLLLTCPQVEAEVSELIDRLKSSGQLRYKLDVVVESEQFMYPTWTCIPALSSHVDVVEVDFRIMGVRGKARSRFQGGDGDGRPGYMTWSLLELMTNFLGQGPNAMVQYLPGQAPRTSIGTIRINVIRPEEPEGGFIPFDEKWPMNLGRRADALGKMMHPEKLFCYIKRDLGILMHVGRKEVRTYCPHAERVFEGVERIEVGIEGGVNGVTKGEWDVREMARLRGD